MKVIFNGSVYDSISEACRATGLKRNDPRLRLTTGLYIVKSDERYCLCQKDMKGGFTELITGKFVPGRRAVDVTKAMYEGVEMEMNAYEGKCVELGGGYRVYQSGKIVGPQCEEGLKPQKDGCVVMKGRRVKVAELVADCFVPKIMGMNFVGHKDGNRRNNAARNLEWRFEREGRKGLGVMRSDANGKNAVVYRNVKEAAAARGVSVQAIYQFIWERKEDSKGYIWRYESN